MFPPIEACTRSGLKSPVWDSEAPTSLRGTTVGTSNTTCPTCPSTSCTAWRSTSELGTGALVNRVNRNRWSGDKRTQPVREEKQQRSICAIQSEEQDQKEDQQDSVVKEVESATASLLTQLKWSTARPHRRPFQNQKNEKSQKPEGKIFSEHSFRTALLTGSSWEHNQRLSGTWYRPA